MLPTRQMKCRPRGSVALRGAAPPRARSAGRSRGRGAGGGGSAPGRPGRRGTSWRLKPSMRSRRPPQPRRAGRHVAGARVGAPDMGAERAALAVRIAGIGEVVERDASAWLVPTPSIQSWLSGASGWPVARAADHRRGQALALARHRRPPARSTKRQKPRHVLVELAEHEIAAVAAEIAPVGHLLGRRQVERARIAHRVDQRPLRVAPVLVGIAEHDLAERDQVDVVERALGGRQAARPSRAAAGSPPSAKPNGSTGRMLGGRQQRLDAERLVPVRALDLLPASSPSPPASAIEHHQQMRLAVRAAPVPVASGALAPTSPSRRERLASPAMPGEELVREALRAPRRRRPAPAGPAPVNATCSAVVGRGSVFSALLTGACSQPAAGRLAVGDLEQEEAGLVQPAVAEADQALQVAELDRSGPGATDGSMLSSEPSLSGGAGPARRIRQGASVTRGEAIPWPPCRSSTAARCPRGSGVLRCRSTTVRPG